MSHERDTRDTALAALLREHASEAPPAHVDATIRTAARREIEHAQVKHLARPHARALQAWRAWMPLAAAAVIGVIVIGVLPLAPSIVDDSAQRASDAPTESATSPVRTSPAPVPTQEAAKPAALPTQEAAKPAALPTQEAAKPAALPTQEPAKPPPAPTQESAMPAAVATLQAARPAPVPTQETPPSAPLPRAATPRTQSEPPPLAQLQRGDTADSKTPSPPGTSVAPGFASPPPSDALALRKEQREVRVPSAIAPTPADRSSTAGVAAAPPRAAAARPYAEAEARADAASNAHGETDRVQGALPRSRTGEHSKLATEASPGTDATLAIDTWIARIRALRSAGDAEGALRELRRYRATFDNADARLPPDLAEWARSQR